MAYRLVVLQKMAYGWRIDGTWESINRALRERLRGVRLKRDLQPSAGVVDSQGR